MKYMTTKEIAQVYRVDEETIRRWCQKGRIKCKKIGKRWFINKDMHNIDES